MEDPPSAISFFVFALRNGDSESEAIFANPRKTRFVKAITTGRECFR
jgi:hypothetical protein